MNAGVTFERVYRVLKEQLGSGCFAAGQHLEPAALAHGLNASITPVRDALHRLAGEGLVDTPRGEGFRTPPATEMGLRHLYRWNAALLALASRPQRGEPAPQEADGAEPLDATIAATERLFTGIAARPGNPEHVLAVVRLNERLRPVRHVEAALMPDRASELGEIASQLEHGTPAELRRSLASYHRRRERAVAQIVAALVVPP